MKSLFLLILFSLPALAQIDHSGLWTSGMRKQKELGACHTFATVALIEALVAEVQHQPIDLSEADLFAKKLFGPTLMEAKALVKSTQTLGVQVVSDRDAGYVDDDFSLAKKNGIRLETETPYNPFLKLLSSLKKVKRSQDYYSAHEGEFEELYSRSVEADFIRDFLKDYKIVLLPFSYDVTEKERVLREALSCRPVAISVRSEALDPSAGGGMHAVVISGIEGKKFLLRNSWSAGSKTSVDIARVLPAIERAYVITEKGRKDVRTNCH